MDIGQSARTGEWEWQSAWALRKKEKIASKSG